MKKNQTKSLIIGINLSCYGSSGTIMINSLIYAHNLGNFDFFTLTPDGENSNNHLNYDNMHSFFFKLKYFLIFDVFKKRAVDGFYYKENTRKIISKIKKLKKRYKNTIIHLHTLHGAKIHLKLLYKFLAKEKFPVVYTFHDCWPLTGGCYCFSHINCEKWKNKCESCPQNIYRSEANLLSRINYLNKFKNLNIVTVSNWLKEQVSNSKLKSNNLMTIYGETNIKVTKINRDDFKKQLGLTNKKIILSVSAYWNEWKGIKYIYKIADFLPKNYVLIVIGGSIEKGHKNIMHFDNMSNNELSKFYSIADVYLSTTQAEALGLTTCEAQLHGCPVIGFGKCGSKETYTSETGFIVKDCNIQQTVKKIIETCENNPFDKNVIIRNGEKFSGYVNSKKYLILYQSLLEKTRNHCVSRKTIFNTIK